MYSVTDTAITLNKAFQTFERLCFEKNKLL